MEKLVRKKGSIKSKLTNFKKFIASLEANFPEKCISEQNIVLDLEQRIDRFQNLLDQYEEVHLQILDITDDPEGQNIECEEFETAFFSNLGKAKAFIVANNKQELRSSSPSSSGRTVASQLSIPAGSNAVNLTNARGVRLPVIESPTFNGDYDTWLEFRDTYGSLIHENTDLTEIQKFHYLRASLGTKVLEIIASLEFTSTNYEFAWNLLCDRYNNSRILIQNHVKALFNIEKINEESSCSLRKIVDDVAKHLRALKALKEPTDTWDTLLLHLITTKLDSVTFRKWEQVKATFEIQSLEKLRIFLKDRADLLESLEQSKTDKGSTKHKHNFRSKPQSSTRSFVTSNVRCSYCKGEHYIQDCTDFGKLNVNDRIEQARKKHLCLNCLRSGHVIRQCYSGPCKICKARHNTLLHIIRDETGNSEENSKKESKEESVSLSSRNLLNNEQVIISTVLVNIFDKNNKAHTVRALLDSGSQSSFISEELCSKLMLPQSVIDIKVGSLNQTHTVAKGRVMTRVQAQHNNFSIDVSCLVIQQITGDLPNFKIDMRTLNIPNNITLADPHFHIPGKVDMLIGADCFWNIMCVGHINLGRFGPVLQKSKFGWFISGRIQSSGFSHNVHCNFIKTIDVDEHLTRFWEIEEIPNVKPLSREEKFCEEHFVSTVKRNAEGKFVVTIPLKDSLDKLGDSYETAKRRLLTLERKFEHNESFKSQYYHFINEYRNLGHMHKIEEPLSKQQAYYLPHHGVLKENSSTTKLRVVFDASCATSTGYSLNDLQSVGPTIQPDLFSTLLRYRKHNYVIAADIEKMYRMCLVIPEQQSLQRILWRDNPEEPISIYELATITYGTAAASYLAIRCLYQLGIECEAESPIISNIIKKDFYVDDLLSGGESVDDVILIANEVSRVLSKGGFHLRKWISNSTEILEGIKTEHVSDSVDLGVNENTKTLGMFWNGRRDCFFFMIGSNFNKRITKRTVLSEISQIFDPLGLLSPCIILAKIILRDIWCEKLDWDHSLSNQLHSRWLQFRDELSSINNINISRQVTCKNASNLEVHGFSDASANAYGCCVYIRSQNHNGETYVRLVCAKTKVAPLKTQTIPRLELMAALLLARLVGKVKTALDACIKDITFWCDSTIVLGWLHTVPNLLQVFVSNRVSEIQELSNIENWRHVPTSDNPADYVSRGVRPSHLSSLDNYWQGPRWLSECENSWPIFRNFETDLPDLRKNVQCHKIVIKIPLININDYSNLTRLERVIAYCFRFIENCTKTKLNRNIEPLSAKEIHNASIYLIKISQQHSFNEEIVALTNGSKINNKSKLLKLHPFLDDNGILRVGGRLSNSNFGFNKKHPILLCSKNSYTKLLFVREHKRLLHAGPQLLLSTIREDFWPISGRCLARTISHECVRCFRVKPISINPIMGQLPSERVNPAPPFFNAGVDYAGPFIIKDRQGRGCKTSKAYIGLFICFVTRAIHIELISNLTTEAFLAAFRRFIARRGKPSQIFSDNGTNFVGANLELQRLGTFLQDHSKVLIESIENEGVSWSFIPAHSPHFGGLWEAGVKATKYHLQRVAGNALLTYEQLYTLLVQIESVLNSRPMTPLSCDPSDLTPLTPSHFLIGRPMTSIANPDLMQIPENRLSHYQRIQQLQQNFWSRWSLEYVSELQQRCKWKSQQGLLKVNDLVVIKEDNRPPLKWLLGRITTLHPGKDGVARVATLRTNAGFIRRSFAKICPLPLNY